MGRIIENIIIEINGIRHKLIIPEENSELVNLNCYVCDICSLNTICNEFDEPPCILVNTVTFPYVHFKDIT